MPRTHTRPLGRTGADETARILIELACSLGEDGDSVRPDVVAWRLGVPVEQAEKLVTLLVEIASGEHTHMCLVEEDGTYFLHEASRGVRGRALRLTPAETNALLTALAWLGVGDDDPLRAELAPLLCDDAAGKKGGAGDAGKKGGASGRAGTGDGAVEAGTGRAAGSAAAAADGAAGAAAAGEVAEDGETGASAADRTAGAGAAAAGVGAERGNAGTNGTGAATEAPAGVPVGGVPVLEIARAVALGRELSFCYRRGGDGQPAERHVLPWRLRCEDKLWYLDASDFDRGGAERTFRVDWMAPAEGAGADADAGAGVAEGASPEAGAAAGAAGPGAAPGVGPAAEPDAGPAGPGTVAGPAPRTVRLTFKEPRYLDLLPWHDLELEAADAAGAVHATTSYYGGDWLPRMLCACGGSASTDDPELAARVRALAAEQLAQARS